MPAPSPDASRNAVEKSTIQTQIFSLNRKRMKTSHLLGVLEVLWFLEKLKLSNHLVNENKINLRIPKILHVDCAYLPIVHIKANIFDNFLSFSILSLIPSPNRLVAATDKSILKNTLRRKMLNH